MHMYILDKDLMTDIVESARQNAHKKLINSLEFSDMTKKGVAHACSEYKSWFLDSLIRNFNRVKKEQSDERTFPIKRLLDRLAEKGVTEHSVTTPPLCLTVKYQDMTISFTYSDNGPIAILNGFEVRVHKWDEDVVELLEAIHAECKESNILSCVESTINGYMVEKVQNGVMISTAVGLIKTLMPDIEYEIVDQMVEKEKITIRLATQWGSFAIKGRLETFAQKVEAKILEIKDAISCNNRVDFE